MTLLGQRLEEARQTGDWNALAAEIPYLRFLGVTVKEQNGVLIGCMPAADHLVGNSTLPALHGGTLGALLESIAQFELLYRAETLVRPKTINFTIDYLRSGKLQDTYARARIHRQGRRVTTVHAEAWQENEAEPIATAMVHLLIIGKSS